MLPSATSRSTAPGRTWSTPGSAAGLPSRTWMPGTSVRLSSTTAALSTSPVRRSSTYGWLVPATTAAGRRTPAHLVTARTGRRWFRRHLRARGTDNKVRRSCGGSPLDPPHDCLVRGLQRHLRLLDPVGTTGAEGKDQCDRAEQ